MTWRHEFSGRRLLAMALISSAACAGGRSAGPSGGVVADRDHGLCSTVQVTRHGRSTEVSLCDPATQILDGGRYARLSDVVALAAADRPLTRIEVLGFRAVDGFSPASKPDCAALFPLAGEKLARGYIGLGSRTLEWDEGLAFPGCMSASGTAEIILGDR